MQTEWVNSHRPVVQKLVNAFVKTLQFIHTHSAEEITAKMPADYYTGDKEMYVKALANGRITFIPDGRMPDSGPATVLKVLSASDNSVKSRRIDPSNTDTTEFVSAAAVQ